MKGNSSNKARKIFLHSYVNTKVLLFHTVALNQYGNLEILRVVTP